MQASARWPKVGFLRPPVPRRSQVPFLLFRSCRRPKIRENVRKYRNCSRPSSSHREGVYSPSGRIARRRRPISRRKRPALARFHATLRKHGKDRCGDRLRCECREIRTDDGRDRRAGLRPSSQIACSLQCSSVGSPDVGRACLNKAVAVGGGILSAALSGQARRARSAPVRDRFDDAVRIQARMSSRRNSIEVDSSTSGICSLGRKRDGLVNDGRCSEPSSSTIFWKTCSRRPIRRCSRGAIGRSLPLRCAITRWIGARHSDAGNARFETRFSFLSYARDTSGSIFAGNSERTRGGILRLPLLLPPFRMHPRLDVRRRQRRACPKSCRRPSRRP